MKVPKVGPFGALWIATGVIIATPSCMQLVFDHVDHLPVWEHRIAQIIIKQEKEIQEEDRILQQIAEHELRQPASKLHEFALSNSSKPKP